VEIYNFKEKKWKQMFTVLAHHTTNKDTYVLYFFKRKHLKEKCLFQLDLRLFSVVITVGLKGKEMCIKLISREKRTSAFLFYFEKKEFI